MFAVESDEPSPQLMDTEGVARLVLDAQANAVTFKGAVPERGVTLKVIDGAAWGATVTADIAVPLAPRSSVTVAMIVYVPPLE